MILTTLLVSLLQKNDVFVILGGTSATNNNYYFNYTSDANVQSYNFTSKNWEVAKNPMPGGQGNGSSIWPVFGDMLSNQSNVFIFDCAREGANIVDWQYNGKYYNTSLNCFSLANNFTKNKYNILWQEGPQDNYYSYQTNYFINVLSNLINMSGPKAKWYLSVYTNGLNEFARLDKIYDIITLNNNFYNVYVGANFDSLCIEDPPFNVNTIYNLANLWYKSLNNTKINNSSDLFFTCISGFKLTDIIFYFSILVIFISSVISIIYLYKYRKKRAEYQRLIQN